MIRHRKNKSTKCPRRVQENYNIVDFDALWDIYGDDIENFALKAASKSNVNISDVEDYLRTKVKKEEVARIMKMIYKQISSSFSREKVTNREPRIYDTSRTTRLNRESMNSSRKLREDVYSIIYDFDDEWAGTGTTEEEFEGTWLELQNYIKQLKKNGCYHIDATCISDCYESKKTSKKLRIKEALGQTLYCVAGFDESENQSYNGGNLVLVSFKSLGDAEDFEEMIVQHVKDAEKQSSYDYDYEDYEDYLDPEYFDVTLGYLDADSDVLYDLNCAGVYTVDIREALNAVDHDNSIIPGFEVVILNQKDIDAHKIIWFENIPDKYYK